MPNFPHNFFQSILAFTALFYVFHVVIFFIVLFLLKLKGNSTAPWGAWFRLSEQALYESVCACVVSLS